MEELLRDISNNPSQEQQQQPVLKTFERRRRNASCTIPEEEPATPTSDAASPAISCCPSDTTTSSLFAGASSARPSTAATGLSRNGRCSSVLRAAALPGHQLFSSHASRSLLLAKMSKARRKAYLAYTQQMAEYFAEVDQFELLEESPGAATEKKARSKLPPGAGSAAPLTPLAWQQRQSQGAFFSTTPAAAAQQTGGSKASSACLTAATAAAAADDDDYDGTAQHSGVQAKSGVLDEALLASPPPTSSSPQSAAAEGGAGSADLLAATPAVSSAQAGTAVEDSYCSARSPLASAGAAASDTTAPVEARLQQEQQQGSAVSRNSSSSSLSGLQHVGLDCLPCISSRLSGLSLEACTPQAAHALLPPAAAAPDTAATAAAQAGKSSSSRRLKAASVDSASAECVAPHHLALQQQQEDEQHANSSRLDLAAHTPAALQQTDMQQLMQQMWMATTPPAAAEVSLEGPPMAWQQGSVAQQESSREGDAEKLQQASRQQKHHLKQQHQQQPAQQAAEATASAAANAVDEEAQRQQEEQQQLAEQHYQAWLQKQAEAAAQAELQQLELAATAAADLSPLQQMLQACGQSASLQDIPCMRDFLSDVVDLRDLVKIGEGTYGEAFKSGQVVLKFVPMEGSNLINGWPQKGAGDLLGEAIIALALSDLQQEIDETGALHASYTDAFVQTHRVGVCRGPYPAAFIKAWKAWDKRHKSENDPIAGLPDGQLYAVFAMANCGRDLESFVLQGYEQVRSLMLQTALALAVAEEALAFEHRDLHFGNIMLSPAQDTHITARLKGCSIRVHAVGVRVRLIDFTASRLQTPGGDVVFCDLEGEDGLFDGPKGKPQFETYRRMRKLTGKDWAGSYATNVLWLLYLTELLLSSDKPIPGATAAQKRNLREFKKRVGGYSCCSDVIWDELFEGLWAAV